MGRGVPERAAAVAGDPRARLPRLAQAGLALGAGAPPGRGTHDPAALPAAGRRGHGTDHTARRPSPVRPATRLPLVRAPTDLSANEQRLLACLQAACPDAATAYPLRQRFVRLVREQRDELLEPWFAAAMGSAVPDLRSFAVALQEEAAALRAALTLPWGTGPVEGRITRLKLLKRQGYGRSSLETLRRRMLYAVWRRARPARKLRKSPENGAGGDRPGASHAAVKVSAATSMPT